MDRSSYFYQLIQFALSTDESGNYKYWQKNVFAESQLVPGAAEKAADDSKEALAAARRQRKQEKRDRGTLATI